VPRSPAATDPNFDIAWEHNGAFYVAEVKSTTPENEEKQLRLVLGQVLRLSFAKTRSWDWTTEGR
jgi:hypothetical protein